VVRHQNSDFWQKSEFYVHNADFIDIIFQSLDVHLSDSSRHYRPHTENCCSRY
jgi:hypothetical protein